MFSFIVTFLLLALGIYAIKKVRYTVLKLPLIFFIGIWTLVLFMSSFNAYNLYPVSTLTLIIIGLHVALFVFGFLFVNYLIGPQKIKQFKHTRIKLNKLYKGNALPIIATIACIPLLILAYRYASFASTSAIDSRSVRFEAGALFGSAAEAVIYNYFGATYFTIFSSIFFYGIISGRIKLKLFVPTIISLLCYLIIGFGRLVFVQLLLSFLIVYLLQPRLKKKKKYKTVLFLFLLVAAFGLVLVLVTALRRGESVNFSNFFSIIGRTFEETFSQLYRYSVGPIRAFDYSVQNYVDGFGFHYGRMTFSGFDELLLYGLSIFKIGTPLTMNNIFGELTSVPVPIGEDLTIIALFTGLFNFYFDFGIFGVVIFSFALGCLMSYVSNLVLRKRSFSLPRLILYIYLIYCCTLIPIKWQISAPDSIITIVILFIWIKCEKRRKRVKKKVVNKHEDATISQQCLNQVN